MRIEFKKQKVKKSKFFIFCENNDANFFETEEDGGYGVWIIPKKYGSYLFGIKLRKDGEIDFVKIDESCMNVSCSSGAGIYPEEQEWIIQTLTLFKKYKKVK